MTGKIPKFDQQTLTGVIQTGDPVQFGCVQCLYEGLTSPAEGHVAYFSQGSSYCAKHLTAAFAKAASDAQAS